MACRLLQAELQALHETLGGIIAGLGVYIEGPECASQVKVKMYKEQKSKDVDKTVPALIDRLASFGFFRCLINLWLPWLFTATYGLMVVSTRLCRIKDTIRILSALS
jgi:hypothetical protein